MTREELGKEGILCQASAPTSGETSSSLSAPLQSGSECLAKLPWQPMATALRDGQSILIEFAGADGRPLCGIVYWGCAEHSHMSSRHPSRCDHCAKGWLGGFGMKFVAEPIAWMEISPSSHVSGVGAEAEKSEQEQVYYLTLARDIYKRQLVQKRQDIAELYMKMDALEDALMPFAAAANSPSLDIGSCVKRKAVKHSDCEHALKVLLKLNQKSWIEEAEQSVADDAHLQVQQVPDTPYSL